MAFVYFPNGANQPDWWPTGEGKDFQLNRTMEPLETVKDQIQVIGGLDHINATAGPDGPRRPRPGQRHVPDRRPGQEDRRGRHPRGGLDRPGHRQPDRPPDPVPLAGADLRRRPASRATATPAIRAPTSTTSSWRSPTTPIAARAQPPARSSSASSAPGRPASARPDLQAAAGAAAVDPRLRARRRPRPPARARLPRPREARRVPDQRPRDRDADRSRPSGSATGARPRRATPRPASRPTSRTTSSSCTT